MGSVKVNFLFGGGGGHFYMFRMLPINGLYSNLDSFLLLNRLYRREFFDWFKTPTLWSISLIWNSFSSNSWVQTERPIYYCFEVRTSNGLWHSATEELKYPTNIFMKLFVYFFVRHIRKLTFLRKVFGWKYSILDSCPFS